MQSVGHQLHDLSITRDLEMQLAKEEGDVGSQATYSVRCGWASPFVRVPVGFGLGPWPDHQKEVKSLWRSDWCHLEGWNEGLPVEGGQTLGTEFCRDFARDRFSDRMLPKFFQRG